MRKLDAIRKMAGLLSTESCDCRDCIKEAAISTLGNIGSNQKKLKPSAINSNDISSNPMRQKQLGDKTNNVYLNNNSLQQPINPANM